VLHPEPEWAVQAAIQWRAERDRRQYRRAP
jgi:hypothetical protein